VRKSCWCARASDSGMDKRNLYWQSFYAELSVTTLLGCDLHFAARAGGMRIASAGFSERNSLTQWNVELRLTAADGLLVGGLGRCGRRQHRRPQHQPRTPLLMEKRSNGAHIITWKSLCTGDKQISGQPK
jgi:hypothetical protein